MAPAALVALSFWVTPAAAQIGVVVHGRVEDAVSRRPLAGARVASVGDSAAVVFTNAAGEFALQIRTPPPFTVHVEQYGYESQDFALGDDAPARISVLLLEPDVIELEGMEVVQKAAIDELLGDLRTRRRRYDGPVTALDRADLDELGAFGTVWDFVRTRLPMIFPCTSSVSGWCVPGRTQTFSNTMPESPVRVCIDAWESWRAEGELSSLDLDAVALIEIFDRGRGGIRIYTPGYLLANAVDGEMIARPLWMGC